LNGSGKTTLAKRVLPFFEITQFVNADEIAAGLSPLAPESAALSAGRLVLQRQQELADKGESFALESTLASRQNPYRLAVTLYDPARYKAIQDARQAEEQR
jgi:predicted ABC-type ATPase